MDHIEERFDKALKWIDKYRAELEADFNSAIENDEPMDSIKHQLTGVTEAYQIVRACAETEWWILEQMRGETDGRPD